MCSITTEGTKRDILQAHPEVFAGVGKLKDYQLSLHIERVKPMVQTVRKLRFSMREKVDRKLNELLQKDKTEEVKSLPIKWVSPFPTIKDVLLDLQGSTIFSKCDLKWGIHHIELDQKSREITANRGLYRYKRLLF